VVITVNGKPFFQLVLLNENDDLIDRLLEQHPGFRTCWNSDWENAAFLRPPRSANSRQPGHVPCRAPAIKDVRVVLAAGNRDRKGNFRNGWRGPRDRQAALDRSRRYM
jgi:hypothetical protein